MSDRGVWLFLSDAFHGVHRTRRFIVKLLNLLIGAGRRIASHLAVIDNADKSIGKLLGRTVRVKLSCDIVACKL